jgi:hypothetical protein
LPGGVIFEGEVKDGKRHGHGKMTYPDERVFEGEFINNEANGPGKMTYSNGAFFTGTYENGMGIGTGTLIVPDKMTFLETLAFICQREFGTGTKRSLDKTQKNVFFFSNKGIIS